MGSDPLHPEPSAAVAADASVPAGPAGRPLRERLAWEGSTGRIHDGPRRYLMMRPDVLMGSLAALAPAERQEALQAWTASTRDHGADSLRAYAAMVRGDQAALCAVTAAAAADLGWGRWSLSADDRSIVLDVHDSPFVAGWRAAAKGAAAMHPVCAPVLGMLQALAAEIFAGDCEVRETHCAATQTSSWADTTSPVEVGPESHACCRFSAWKVGP